MPIFLWHGVPLFLSAPVSIVAAPRAALGHTYNGQPAVCLTRVAGRLSSPSRRLFPRVHTWQLYLPLQTPQVTEKSERRQRRQSHSLFCHGVLQGYSRALISQHTGRIPGTRAMAQAQLQLARTPGGRRRTQDASSSPVFNRYRTFFPSSVNLGARVRAVSAAPARQRGARGQARGTRTSSRCGSALSPSSSTP
jgi:hypothetical protein